MKKRPSRALAKRIAKELGARGVIVIAFGEDGLIAGVTSVPEQPLTEPLDRTLDAITQAIEVEELPLELK